MNVLRGRARTKFSWLIAIFLASLMSLGQMPAMAVEQTSITGTVTMPAGLSAETVNVNVYDESGSSVSYAQAAADGTYTLPDVAAGTYKLEFSDNSGETANQWFAGKKDFATADAVTVNDGAQTAGINVTMVRAAGISGQVSVPAGYDPSAVEVTLYDEFRNWVGTSPVAADGSYAFRGLSGGSYRLWFSAYNSDLLAQWYGGEAGLITVADTESVAGINVTMVKGATIAGRISVPDGISPETVHVTAEDGQGNYGVAQGAVDGTYTIRGLVAGTYKLFFTANASNYGTVNLRDQWYSGKETADAADAVVVGAGADVTDVNITMVKGASISGRVSAPAGMTLDGVNVKIQGINDQNSRWGNLQSDGTYSFIGLPAGGYKLHFITDGTNIAEQWYGGQHSFATAETVTVTDGQDVTGIDAALQQGATISGHVTVPEGNLSNISVTAFDADQSVARTTIAYSGTYQLIGLRAGTYKVKFEDNGGHLTTQWHAGKPSFETADALTLAAGEAVTGINAVMASGSSITGTVTVPEGQSAEDVHVEAYTAENFHVGWSSVAADGTYAFNGLEAGSYRLKFASYNANLVDQWYAGKSSYETADALILAEGQARTGVNVTMVKGASISGRVTAAAGTTLSDISVAAYGVSGSHPAWAQVSADGTYRIQGLTAGTYKLEYSGTDMLSQWYNGKATQETADGVTVTQGEDATVNDVAMVKGASIAGKITLPPGVNTEYAYVTAYDANQNYAGSSWIRTDGSYLIRGLTAGSYKITFEDWGGNGLLTQWYSGKASFETADPIALTAGQAVADINMTVRMGATISGKATVPAGVDASRVYVEAFTEENSAPGYAQLSTDGSYAIKGLAAGSYKLRFVGNGNGVVTQWYAGKSSFATADAVAVTEGGSATGIDVALATGGTITGTITFPAAATTAVRPAAASGGALVEAIAADGEVAAVTGVGVGGTYSLTGLAAGTYTVKFFGSPYDLYEAQFYRGVPESAGSGAATPVTVTTGATTANIDATAVRGGSVTGTAQGADGTPLANRHVEVYAADGKLTKRIGYTNTDGTFTVHGLSTGSYLVKITGTTPLYYPGTESDTEAAAVAVTVGQAKDLGVIAPLKKFTGVVAPAISGYAIVGFTLKGAVAATSPAASATTWQWLRNGTAISGATSASYKLTTADLGKRISVKVTRTLAGYAPAESTSAQTIAVQGLFTGVKAPTISGYAIVGYTLKATAAAVTPAAASTTFQWLRNGVPISGARYASYKLTTYDFGKKISVKATRTLSGYRSSVTTSAQTIAVQGVFAGVKAPTISGYAIVGYTLKATAAATTPAAASTTFQWLRNGVVIYGARYASYKLTAYDFGKRISVRATRTRTGYRPSYTVSAQTGYILRTFTGLKAPAITGTPGLGKILTASVTKPSPLPAATTYQWLRNGVAIYKATGASYKLTSLDRGKLIRVRVTFTRSGYRTAALISGYKLFK